MYREGMGLNPLRELAPGEENLSPLDIALLVIVGLLVLGLVLWAAFGG